MDLLKELHHNLNSPRKWVKGSSVGGSADERHCMVGWLIELNKYGSPAPVSEATYALARVIQEQYPGLFTHRNNPTGAIVRFNDHKDTKFVDVQRVIEKAIVRQEEEI